MSEPTLTQLLELLASRQPIAQQIWERNMREERGDDWEPYAGEVWLTLEFGFDGDPRWHCGFRARSQRGDVWALRSVRRTPEAAAAAMLENLAEG
ncbi:MAG TPA: hypothetical protein VFS21_29725 [Roseiflexaceae bacterium]|nr:hypothetical protein [Roseiflexaceae bacterium]